MDSFRILSDHFGERTFLMVSTVVSAITLFIVIGARFVIVLFVATTMFGLALSLYAVARYTLLVSVYSNHLGAANGVASAVSDTGQSVLPPLAGLIVGVAAWQFSLGFSIPLFLYISGVLWIVILREARTQQKQIRGINIIFLMCSLLSIVDHRLFEGQ